jgi:hypothetical protein
MRKVVAMVGMANTPRPRLKLSRAFINPEYVVGIFFIFKLRTFGIFQGG